MYVAMLPSPFTVMQFSACFLLKLHLERHFLREYEKKERERLDVLTSKMRAGQRNTFVRTAVRAVNSAAHPLRNVGNNDAVR